MSLPKCTGIFGVGCVDIMTKTRVIPRDMDPKSICASNLGSFMRLYFPCEKLDTNTTLKNATWIPEPNQKLYSYAFANYVKMGNVIGWMAHMWARNITMDAITNATVIDQSSWKDLQTAVHSLKENEKLPLIIFSHGLGGQRALYSVFCTQLASEGFLVAAVEHRDRSSTSTFIMEEDGNAVEIPYYPNNTKTQEEENELMKLRSIQLEKRTDEVIAVLDVLEKLDDTPEDVHNCLQSECNLKMFKGRIDTTYPIMMGHSFGGATTLNALKKEPRLKCGFGLDVWFEPFTESFFTGNEEINKPVFLIFTEYFNWKYNMKRCYQYMKDCTTDFVEVVTLKKARHYDQCDIPGIIPSFISSWIIKKKKDVIPYKDAISAQRKLMMDYIGKCFQHKGTGGSVKLLDDEYTLDEVFMVGSDIQDDGE